jgi:hypothetical protein
MEPKVMEYEASLLSKIDEETKNNSIKESDAFTNLALEKLENYGVITNPTPFSFSCRWQKDELIAINGYSYDETDSSLCLFITDFTNYTNDLLLSSEDINKLYVSLWRFVEASLIGNLYKYTDNLEAIRIGKNISYNLNNMDLNSETQRIKLFVLTNKSSSDRKKTVFLKSKIADQKDISYQIWDIDRFFSNDSSGKERESILIDFQSECKLEYGISCISADVSGNGEFQSYMCIMPGKALALLYHHYGSVLLEQNVRAYLGARTKINSGILRTIKLEPEKFFIYNNGISVTGNDVKFEMDSQGKQYISQITDMQIINGGQTTASLYTAFMNDQNSLSEVFVPMKLTVITHDEDYDDMVTNISHYSNSQTAVRSGDFFSAHPFHRRLEQLAKSTPTPNSNALSKDSYWYYERTRGQYNQETFKSTNSEKKEFETKFPRKNIIKKEELAKYYITMQKKPYIAAKGAAKCMEEFAPLADTLFSSDPDHTKINKAFFERCVCYTIIFRKTDEIVSQSDWYTVNGFKNVIVPYAIARVLEAIPKGESLDYGLIWKSQDIYPALRNALILETKAAHDFFRNAPNGGIVTEFAKKEETWQIFANTLVNFSDDFFDSLSNQKTQGEKETIEKHNATETFNVKHINEMVSYGSAYWNELLNEGIKRRLLKYSEIDLLSMMANFDLNNYHTKVPSDRQFKAIWRIKTMLEEKGLVVIPPSEN